MVQNHTKIPFLLPLLICLFFFWSCNSSSPKTESPSQPNIIFIFSDDQTYTALRAGGNTEIYTPNLDRLSKGGTTFTHAYNMGGWNGAVCVASRAMMNSGRFVWRAKAFKENWRKGDAFDQSWPRLMEQAGYETYMSGKWHVNAPADSLFQHAKHIRPGMPSYARKGKGPMVVGYNRPLSPEDTSWSPTDTSFGGFWQGGQHWSEVLRDDALGFIDHASKSENPFFMYLAFNAPHDPRQAPQEFLDMYPLDNISLPDSWLPEYPYKNEIGCSPKLRDEALAPFPRTPYAIKVHIQEYYALVSHLDAQIGKILAALEASVDMENTYIFFTSDHGLSVGRHGLLGKQNMFDHSIRVPLMVAGPGIPKGNKISTEVYLQDVMATSLELAKIEKPAYVEFNSLLGLAAGNITQSHYPEIYGCYTQTQRMIRKDGFKLIAYPKAKKLLLFDMNKDPEEKTNLADKSEHQEQIEEMFRDLVQLQKKMGDELILEDVFTSGSSSL